MSDPDATFLLGSAYGPVGLFDAAADLLREQARARGVALVALSRECRAGVGVATAVAAECAAVRAAAPRCERVVATVEDDDAGRARDLLAELAAVTAGSGLDGRIDGRLVVERQDRLAEHRMLAAFRAGRRPPAAADFAHDHAESVRRLQDLPFVGSVSVRPYELVAAGAVSWIDDALGPAGLGGTLDLRPLVHGPGAATLVPYRQWRAAGVELAAALLPELDGAAGAADRELVLDFLHTSFAAAGDDRPIDGPARRAIVARHRQANRDFFSEFGALTGGVPVDSYDDDAATARLAALVVPVTVPGPPPVARARSAARRVTRGMRRRLRRGVSRGAARMITSPRAGSGRRTP